MKDWTRKTLRNKKIADDYKGSHPCIFCGESRVACLDFHHTGDNKKDDIAELITNHVSIKRMTDEMNKCVVLCANCHRILHSVEGNPPRQIKQGETK